MSDLRPQLLAHFSALRGLDPARVSLFVPHDFSACDTARYLQETIDYFGGQSVFIRGVNAILEDDPDLAIELRLQKAHFSDGTGQKMQKTYFRLRIKDAEAQKQAYLHSLDCNFYLWLPKRLPELANLYIDEGERGKGRGRRLLHSFFEGMRVFGKDRVDLTAAHHDGALFWARYGAIPVLSEWQLLIHDLWQERLLVAVHEALSRAGVEEKTRKALVASAALADRRRYQDGDIPLDPDQMKEAQKAFRAQAKALSPALPQETCAVLETADDVMSFLIRNVKQPEAVKEFAEMVEVINGRAVGTWLRGLSWDGVLSVPAAAKRPQSGVQPTAVPASSAQLRAG